MWKISSHFLGSSLEYKVVQLCISIILIHQRKMPS